MSLDVTPGSVVNVKVTRTPNSERAAKTLSRIFGKDAANKRLAKRRQRILQQTADPRRRGGRLWTVKSKAPRLVQPESGDSCTVRATADVISDLGSVRRFVEISPSRG